MQFEWSALFGIQKSILFPKDGPYIWIDWFLDVNIWPLLNEKIKVYFELSYVQSLFEFQANGV